MRRTSERSRRLVRTLGVMVALTVMVVSCGGTKEGSGGGNGSPGKDDGDVIEPFYGGSVVYGLPAENSDGWCLPSAQLASGGIQVARSIYDTLVIPNQDGELVPFLAESLTPNDDFTQWDLVLREGIVFHDGTPLDATVVKNNIDAYRGVYPGRPSLLFQFVFGDIADVETTGPMSLRITTSKPWSSLPAILWSQGRTGIMAQSQLDDAETCSSRLVGTGPFTFVEWSQNQKLVVERNPDYWMKDENGNQLPYLDRIEYRPVTNASSRANGLLAGDLDVTTGISAQDREAMDDAEADGEITNNRSEFGAQPSFLQMNVSKAPFDDKNARMAVITGLDLETFNETVNLGQTKIANGPFAPGNIGYLEDTGYPSYDPDAARRYVAAYKADTGQDLKFSVIAPPDPEVISAMVLIQDMAKKVGVTVSITQMEVAAMVSTAIAGNYESMAFTNFPGGDPDENRVWWYGKGNPVNLSRFDDPEINRLLDEGRATADKEERQSIYADINRRFASEGYIAWLNWSITNIATRSDVHGVYGPRLPNGDDPSPALVMGHSTTGMWRES